MKKNFVAEGKLLFQVLLIIVCQWSSTIGQFNLYDTDRRIPIDSLQFDCLNCHVQRKTWVYQDLFDIVDEIIAYCFRPAREFHESLDSFHGSLHQKIYFNELSLANISAQQLFSWSIAVEVIERYQVYLDEPSPATNEYFYNCTPPRFGLQCQYSFAYGEGLSFDEIVSTSFQGREPYPESSDAIVEVPCYMLLKCHRNGQRWCLDWREICDGTIDCFDESSDEQSCFELEINECSDDEFRCHDGSCVSQEFWENGEGETDCLDRSDAVEDISFTDLCFRNPTFLCEEHSCRVNINRFSCSDGQCVSKFRSCSNGRHMLLLNSLMTPGNLETNCRNAMICLTQLATRVHGMPCKEWGMSNGVGEKALKQCGIFFSFPTVPVHSNHIYSFYDSSDLKFDLNQFLLPHYICYNEKLCDRILPDFVRENQTCFNISRLTSLWEYLQNSWQQIILPIAFYFRSCSILPKALLEEVKYATHPSLHKCGQSKKLISKHRIMDRMPDCYGGDDENYTTSCQLGDPYRVTCVDTTKCWSPLVKNLACVLSNLGHVFKIKFQAFCDGIDEYFYDSMGKKRSDELYCENWLCNNMYTRCDGFPACKDGHDEYNCTQTKCSPNEYPCVSPENYTVICLPFDRVNNNISDCIGDLDEQTTCRKTYSSRNGVVSFRCLNASECLRTTKICDNQPTCRMHDDENENLCKNRSFTCDNNSGHNMNEIEELFCELNRIENRTVKYFSVHTSSNYPAVQESMIDTFNYWPQERLSFGNSQLKQASKNKWPWYCHRGLSTVIWFDHNNTNKSVCICPPSYYGLQCQYQSQRLSLTLRLTSNDRYATYTIISMLVDDTNEQYQIHAYDQFIYIAKQSCSIKLNRYLLFQMRPKNISRNYSVRVDVFQKKAIVYVGSWYFPIVFLFLPVNRLSIALSLSNHRLQQSSHCFNNCINGECIKYVNKDIYFCRCFAQWSGARCNIPIDCQACSSKSMCIGSVNNRSICVCPIDRYGRQCSLTSKCPLNACHNNGQCIPADVTIPGSRYTCVCTDRYFGTNCEYRKAQLEISLNDMDTPSYLVAHFFSLSNRSNPVETTVLRKLTLFQRIVTFHIAVPFQLVFIQADSKYYLVVLQQIPQAHIVTSINPRQECLPVQQLFNRTVMQMISYERIIHFHWLCYTNHSMTCFMDETYLCLCTNAHHANCMEFDHFRNLTCPSNDHCENGGQCLQDHPNCPSTKICLCQGCFFGDQCQFYAKAFGSTLDEILGYEFRRDRSLWKQSFPVVVAAALTILIFLMGVINSILSIVTFSRSKACEVGCGKYLLASSITSLLTMITLVFKFCFLFYSHQDHQHVRRVEEGNCFGIEILLKIFLYLDNWLNACVAFERIVSATKGIAFDKKRSRVIAHRAIISLPFMVIILFVPQFIHLHIFYDAAEERSWCVIRYVQWLSTYSSVIIFIHYFVPLFINVVSVICVIIITARQRSVLQHNHSIWLHVRSRVRKYKHMLGSSVIIIILTLPNLITSILISCRKSSNLFWFYLISYFLSFLPAASCFFIFVLPSSLYRKEFADFIAYIRRRIEVFRLNLMQL